LDEVEPLPWRDTELAWLPLRHALGTRIVGMAAFAAERAGQLVVEPHVEERDGRGHEEVYVVVRGRAGFTVDGERLDAPAGTFIRVDPAVERSAVAAEPDTVVLALGGPPTFEPAADEWIERARPLLRSDPARAREILDELRAGRPDSPGARIASALQAALEGDDARARIELEGVIAGRPELRDSLEADPDLGPLLP
jgi:hypothetical protein